MMILVKNKKILHDYFIIKSYEAGIVLKGWEVKSCRYGYLNIKKGYIKIKNFELFLVGIHISPILEIYNNEKVKKTRVRKILLNLKEINKIIDIVRKNNYTIVPIDFHVKNNFIKCNICIVKGKKKYDKREIEKNKYINKEKNRFFTYKNMLIK